MPSHHQGYYHYEKSDTSITTTTANVIADVYSTLMSVVKFSVSHVLITLLIIVNTFLIRQQPLQLVNVAIATSDVALSNIG